MKRILLLTLAMTILFTTACSMNEDEISTDASSATSNGEQISANQEVESPNTDKVNMEAEMQINIIVENKTFVATLEDNETAIKFAAMLPMTIEMEDVNSNEKYYVLPETIRQETAQNPAMIQAGDLMCYGDAGLVLFYDTFSTAYSYVSIGHIDDAEGLTDVLGSGDIEVTFTAQ